LQFDHTNVISNWTKQAVGTQKVRPNVAVTLTLFNNEIPLTEPGKITSIVITRVSNGALVAKCPSNAASCAVNIQLATFPINITVVSTNYLATPITMTAPN
jgi:hypothetical protein